jgi:hypothetical protein
MALCLQTSIRQNRYLCCRVLRANSFLIRLSFNFHPQAEFSINFAASSTRKKTQKPIRFYRKFHHFYVDQTKILIIFFYSKYFWNFMVEVCDNFEYFCQLETSLSIVLSNFVAKTSFLPIFSAECATSDAETSK